MGADRHRGSRRGGEGEGRGGDGEGTGRGGGGEGRGGDGEGEGLLQEWDLIPLTVTSGNLDFPGLWEELLYCIMTPSACLPLSYTSQRLNEQFHLCVEKFSQLPVNLEAGIQLLGSLEVKVCVCVRTRVV